MLPSYNGSGFTGPHLGLDTIDVNDLTDNVKNSLALQHPSFESITTEAYPSSPATSSSYFTGDDEVFGFDNTFNVNNIFTEDEDEDDGSNFSESDSDSDDEYVPSSSRRGSSSAKGKGKGKAVDDGPSKPEYDPENLPWCVSCYASVVAHSLIAWRRVEKYRPVSLSDVVSHADITSTSTRPVPLPCQ